MATKVNLKSTFQQKILFPIMKTVLSLDMRTSINFFSQRTWSFQNPRASGTIMTKYCT